MKTKIQTQIPEHLNKQMQILISDGWFSNTDEILSNALSRFLDSHRPEIMEHFIQEDIDWGLHGTESKPFFYSM